MIKKLTLLALGAGLIFSAQSQDVENTFDGTRILNGHSVETLKKRVLQFRVEHRFGDMAGADGSVYTFWGLDQAADIRLAFEYGITDHLMIGIGRAKGTGAPYSSLLDGFVKYRFLTQNKARKIPVSATIIGASTLTYQQSVDDISLVQSFPEFAHRLAYTTQLNIARKFGERLSIAFMPTYVHRNLVQADDLNDLFALGAAFNFKILKEFGIVGEYYHCFASADIRQDNFNSLSGGLEWVTNGHNFKIVLTNARGFDETQFIPYTFSNWLDGQFRLGFSITRNFKL